MLHFRECGMQHFRWCILDPTIRSPQCCAGIGPGPRPPVKIDGVCVSPDQVLTQSESLENCQMGRRCIVTREVGPEPFPRSRELVPTRYQTALSLTPGRGAISKEGGRPSHPR